MNGHRSRLGWLSFRRRPTIAVLRLAGVIGAAGPLPLRGGMSLQSLAGPIDRAFRLKHLSAVALCINSPGGSPVQSAQIAKRIRDLARERDVPVIAFVEDIAASGGYWLACAGDEIFADASSIVGSIGVVSAGFGFQELIAKIGVERRVHTSGARKAMLDPFRPEQPDDVALLGALQRDVHESFKAQVRERRGRRLKADEAALFNGEVWSGRRALELGLVDGLGDLRSVLRQRFGDRIRLVPVGGRRGWLSRQLRPGTLLDDGWAGERDWAGELISALEARALWSRYGL
jgi:signal peptide peptidase SppA